MRPPRTAIGTAGQPRHQGELAGQQVLSGMPPGLYPCTPSRLLTFRDCPRRYRFSYLDKPQPPRGAPWAHVSLGAAVHSALARWWWSPSPARSPATGAALVREAWLRDGFRDDAQSAAHRELAARWVEQYLAGLDPAREPIAVERTVAVRTPTMTVSGRVDRLDLRDGELVVIDYKTGRWAPTDDDARASLQLALYALAAERTLRRPAGRVELHHVPTGAVASARHDKAALERSVAEAAAIARDALRADAAHRAGGALADEAFPPAPSRSCSWCDFRRHCPDGRAAAPDVEPWAGLAG